MLAPANEALTNPCLTGPITAYSWVEGIALMTVFALFFVELMAMRFAVFDPTHPGDSPDHPSRSQSLALARKEGPDLERQPAAAARRNSAHIPGEDHLGHSRAHVGEDHEHEHDHRHESGIPLAPAPGSKSAAGPGSNDALWRASLNARPPAAESYSAQLTAIFILEFGVIFHSIFIGLTLAVAGAEFRTLYVVLVFHQTFEGLGLGSRLAVVPWPRHVSTKPGGQRRMPLTPYALAVGYGLSTPVAIAIGLGVREAYQPAGQTNLIVNGVFDSISAGILIYTGLVELMAHEFMFSGVMRRAELRVVLAAFGTMCLGAGTCIPFFLPFARGGVSSSLSSRGRACSFSFSRRRICFLLPTAAWASLLVAVAAWDFPTLGAAALVCLSAGRFFDFWSLHRLVMSPSDGHGPDSSGSLRWPWLGLPFFVRCFQPSVPCLMFLIAISPGLLLCTMSRALWSSSCPTLFVPSASPCCVSPFLPVSHENLNLNSSQP